MTNDELARLLPVTARRSASGQLTVQGLDVAGLAEAHGTPLYIYDQATLDASLEEYLRAISAFWSGSAAIAYAAKAWLTLAMAQWAASRELGLDVVSAGELYIARRAGFPAERLHLHGNNKPYSLLETAVAARVGRIVVDSDTDLERTIQAARVMGGRQSIWLRLNPAVSGQTHQHIETGSVTSKFGISIEDGAARRVALTALAAAEVDLVGLHVHIGSQIGSPDPFLAATDRVLDFAATLTDETGWRWQEFSPGGGFAVPYTVGAPDLKPATVMSTLAHALQQGCEQRRLPLPHLVLEPGRELVARAGVALYRVGLIKQAGPLRYAFLDGGLADNPRPALYGAHYTAVLANRHAAPTTSYTLAGPFCESGDVLIQNCLLPALEPGDLIALPVSGAYQLSMASAYNAAPRPAVLWLQDGRATLVQRRETLEDLLARDVSLLDLCEGSSRG